ncbi:MAG: GGDEF domain-containing protein [Lachnospiraceae bacterium]|nr:GGDEF domain-containing protein [Lachnospiraceae bacterium]
MFYSSFGILAILVHIIINYDVLIKNDYRDVMPAGSTYRQFLIGILIYYVSDICWGLLYERRLTALTYADTVLYFLSMVVSVLLWTRYVTEYLDESSLFSRIIRSVGMVILLYEIINLIINFFRPVVFSFAEDGTYQPMTARYVTLAIQILFYSSASVYSLYMAVRGTGITRRHHRTVGLCGLTMAAFIILQAYDPFLPFYAVGCMLGTCLLHTFVLEDEKAERKKHLEDLLHKEKTQREELEAARHKAYTDSLTGVKSKHAYLEAEMELDERIAVDEVNYFGLIVFDLNGLKAINDTMGHEAGDRYIKEGCNLICCTFVHSPVFRIGGDEFVVILEGNDYNNRNGLIDDFDKHIHENIRNGKVIVSSGMDEYRPGLDDRVQSVFERADRQMYENKKYLKKLTARSSS